MKFNCFKTIAIALLLLGSGLLSGCGTHNVVIDLGNGDTFGYTTYIWQNEKEQEVAARAEYYAWGARTQYPTNECHRLEVVLFQDAQTTNVMKKAVYFIHGKKEEK